MTRRMHKWLIPIIIFVLLITMQTIYIALIVSPNLTEDIYYVTLSSLGAIVFSAAVDILFIRYISNSDRYFELEKEAELKANLVHLDKKYFEIMENELALSRELKKDILTHIEDIRNNIEAGVNKDNSKSINAINEDIECFHALHYCEEPTVDMVLTLKKNKADKEYVPMSIKAVVPSDVNISKLDLSSGVSNMIDNAIEASIQAREDGIEPFVNVDIALRGDFLVIRTENPTSFNGKINDIEDLKTTKKADSGIHGYGLKILQNICGRYEGELTVDISDHVSVFTIMMVCDNGGGAL